MWAQTYGNGNRYYREHRGSRGAGYCVDRSGSVPCHIPDGQMGRILESILLPKSYLDQVLEEIQLADEVKRVEGERKRVEERVRRLREVYLEGDLLRDQYTERKRGLETELASLIIPDALKPKPAFRVLFQIATTRENSGVILYKENPPDLLTSPEDDSPCSWWSRTGARGDQRYAHAGPVVTAKM